MRYNGSGGGALGFLPILLEKLLLLIIYTTMISLPTLVTLACSVSSCNAFQTAPSTPYRPASLSLLHRAETFLPNSSSIAPQNYRNQSLLLRTATTANGEKAPNDAMIRQIDQKIQNYEKKQEKYLSKLESPRRNLRNSRRQSSVTSKEIRLEQTLPPSVRLLLAPLSRV